MKEPVIRFQDILETVRGYIRDADTEPLRKAYVFAAVAHRGQLRKTGIPYLSHPLAVTKILADLRMDIPTLCGGLLHDVMEDCGVEEEALREHFGDEVTQLVVGLTNTARISLQDSKRQKIEHYRRLLLMMSQDIRIVMIKLADRLHNMRTLYSLSEEQKERISKETLAIYAPLANRLGISWLRSELEDLAFRYLQPELFEDLRARVEEKVKARSSVIQQVSETLQAECAKERIRCTIYGRVKHYHSIYQKMVEQGIDLDQIFDLLAIRVIVSEERQCYQVLGIIHSLWTPVPGRFKDYVARPKPNQYRSLHTTVVGPTGDFLEIQIRTRRMHREAEHGVAAHWIYKESEGFDKEDRRTLQRWREILGALQEISSARNFLDAIRFDLFSDQVYVLTPKGEAKELPRGSTPVDFAYSIHTEVGNHCMQAKVNGKLVPLRYELRNGDVVEILTSKTQTPRRDWLQFVKTREARSKIRAHLRQEERREAQDLGREILEKGLRKLGFQYDKLLKDGGFKRVLKAYELKTMDDLLRVVAYGKLSVSQVAEAIPESPEEREEPSWEEGLDRLVEKAGRAPGTGVRVRGLPNVLVRFARCCNPVHGEEIVGFITRGRGVTIHTRNCSKMKEAAPERCIDVQWDDVSGILQRARIRVVSQDRPGMLAGLSKVIAAGDVNISRAQAWTTGDQLGIVQFDVMVKDLVQLRGLIRSLEKVRGVVAVERVLQ